MENLSCVAGIVMKERHSFSESAEMYLKTIAELSVTEEIVPVTTLAEHLSLSTVSASEMVHKLQAQGLVEHFPYKGVLLTSEGIRRANIVLRRHRLWERFLTDQLNLPWEKAYDFACELEHATDDAVTNALAAFLGSPETCPHGNPIPSAEGQLDVPDGVCLSDMKPGEGGSILRIQGPSSEMLKYLQEKDLRPGKALKIDAVDPFEGPITVALGSTQLVLGRQVAGHIIVAVD
jgi:DtxR family Mn-dependent transcriptional regulator